MIGKTLRRRSVTPSVARASRPQRKQKDAETVATDGEGARARPAASAWDWLDRVWAFFGSQRLALVLILAIAGASLAGVLLMQAPANAQADRVSYARWLAQIRPKYGDFTGALSALGLFTIFGSWWFRLLMAMLAANILVCTLRRSGSKLRAAFGRPRVDMPDAFFQRAKLSFQEQAAGLSKEEATAAVRKSLRMKGYRVTAQPKGNAVHLYADRNRFAPLGSILHHASLVVLLGGFVVGGLWGSGDDGFVVAEGQTRPIGDTGLALRLDSFVDEWYPEGPPKDYRSTVVLYDQGQEVSQAVVRVNQPLVYAGVRVHQSFYGPAAVMEVRDGKGALVAEETVALAWQAQDRPLGSFYLAKQGLEVYVVGPASAFIDSVIPPGQVRLEVYETGATAPYVAGNVAQGQSANIGGLTYTFVRERQFSGFRVVDDPGRPLLWLGAVGMVMGLMLVLYFTHRQVWALCKEEADGTVRVQMGAATGKHGEFTKDFQKLGDSIRGGLRKVGPGAAS